MRSHQDTPTPTSGNPEVKLPQWSRLILNILSSLFWLKNKISSLFYLLPAVSPLPRCVHGCGRVHEHSLRGVKLPAPPPHCPAPPVQLHTVGRLMDRSRLAERLACTPECVLVYIFVQAEGVFKCGGGRLVMEPRRNGS